MCGIAGWFERSGALVNPRLLRRMGESLAHRGPDGDGLWYRGQIGLAHRRLAIRDLSEAGRQPMSDPESRVVVTYNGELYNDAFLRRELERDFGVRFHTSCDTEILPHAYLAWGDAMFERLEGMFAIGLWDVERRRLLLARDGVGIKPLYYAEIDHAVLFASEIKALLAGSEINAFRLDPEALHTFLAAGHAGTQRSLIKGVAQVGPGSVVAFTSRDREARAFWTPRRAPEIVDLEQAIGLSASTLEEVVASQLVSDVPLGVLQSGGIDSTLVSLAVGRTGARPPVFTASFEEPSHDETELGRAVADAVGLPHRVVPVEGASDQVALFQAVVHHFDGQCADTGALAFYRLSQAVRRHSKVALSGDGGDEFFCGYETYAATQIAAALRPLIPGRLARNIGRVAYHRGARAEGRLPLRARVARFGLGFGESERSHLEWRRLVPSFLTHRVYGPTMSGLLGQSPYGEYAHYYDTTYGSILDKAMLADQRFHLQSILAKVDAMSMAHGLEIRVPLLDRRIMELAGRMDLRLLHPRFGPPKYLLRSLARQLGAPEKVTRARKKGFNVPIARLLRRELRPLGDDVLDRQADVLYPYLSPDGVRALWREHREYRSDHAFALWPILTLAIWQAGLAGASRETTRIKLRRRPRALRHAAS